MNNSDKQTGSTLPLPSDGHGLDEDTVHALEMEFSFLKGIQHDVGFFFLTRKMMSFINLFNLLLLRGPTSSPQFSGCL